MTVEIWPKNRQPYHGDITQGALGNCFLISAIQSIASSRPDLLKRIIQPSPLRCFFYRQGEKFEVPVVLEPITEEYQYCRSTEGQAQWPYIIEQGYAQFYGGRYENLSGGNTSESFYDLLGLPVLEFEPKETGLLEKIEKGFKDKTILVTAGFIDTSNKDEPNYSSNLPNGIRKNHAYTVLTTYFHLPTREKYFLIHNPHGINHLTSENSQVRQKFFSSISREYPLWSNTPGTQLITWNEVKTCFNRIQICYLDSQSRSVIQGEWTSSTSGGCSNFSSFHKNPFIILPKSFPSKSFLVLGHRTDQRIERKEITTKFDYSPIGVTLVRIKSHPILTQDNIEVIKQSKFLNKRETTFEIDFQRRPERQYALVLSTYDPNLVDSFWFQIFSKESFPNLSLRTIHYQYQQTIRGEWNSTNAAGRRIKSSKNFFENSSYLLNLSKDSTVYFILQQTFEHFVPFEENHPIGIYILSTKTDDEATFVKARSICHIAHLKSDQEYYILPTCYEANSFGKYQIDILSDFPFNLDQNERKLPLEFVEQLLEKSSDSRSSQEKRKQTMNDNKKPIVPINRRSIVQHSTKRSNSPTKKIPLSLATARSLQLAEQYEDLE